MSKSSERICEKLCWIRDQLQITRQMKCTCPGFYLQYNQGCSCERGREIKRLENEMTKKLDELNMEDK